MNHPPGCACQGLLNRAPRRALLAALAAAPLAAAPRSARAATGRYEAMLLNCIDPRFTTSSFAWMGDESLRDRYSQFTIAGGPIGVVHPRFAAWAPAFWENLAISVDLHAIHTVIAMTHRDCGAARLAYGEAAVATPQAETETHAAALHAFRAALAERHPTLTLRAGVMGLDGAFQPIA